MTGSDRHPARSPEFLSRLHDGELDAAECARFEAHRAHCSECRDAAAQLEEALVFFRSARPGPAAPDLSARILRRLRAGTPRRRPFGRLFGIDLRWAGAFAAALLAVIIGSSIVLERESRGRRVLRDSSAIPVVIEQPRAASPPPAEAKPRRTADSPPLRKKASAPTEPERPLDVKDESSPKAQNRAPAPQSASSDALAPAPESPVVAKPAPRADEPARGNAAEKATDFEERSTATSPRLRAEAQGVEGGAVSGAMTQDTRVRVRVIAPEDAALAPEPSNASELSLSAADRGDYAVIVREDGSVASVRLADSKLDSRGTESRRQRAADELRKLRFAAAGRPRHLIVRVE
jgi:hypothetical protein